MSESNNKQILQFDLDFNFIREFSSQKEAAETLWISAPAISNCVRAHQGYVKWFRFFLKINNKKLYVPYKKKEVYSEPIVPQEFDLSGYKAQIRALKHECHRYASKRIIGDIDPYYS